MKTLVVDVAADSSGALSILNYYYDKFRRDEANEYVLCISTPKNIETNGSVEVLKYPWVKKSWFHRLWFDLIIAPGLVKKYKVDNVFSLQNTTVARTRVPQTLYLHQPLPFVEHKFSFRESKKLWIYQNIISVLIKKSVRKADKVYVQTEWMKKAVAEKCGVGEDKILKVNVDVNIDVKKHFSPAEWERVFFYPASNFCYKNHITLLKAVKLLKDDGVCGFKVLLTLKENELSSECSALYRELGQYVELMGSVPRERVMELYSQSVLLFPSYVETFGLPLLEARMHSAPVIASDMPFCREILDGYDKASFFDPMSARQLKEKMLDYLK